MFAIIHLDHKRMGEVIAFGSQIHRVTPRDLTVYYVPLSIIPLFRPQLRALQARSQLCKWCLQEQEK